MNPNVFLPQKAYPFPQLSNQPLVSIMMPAYNVEKFIGQAIESVINQTYPEWELILVNDGSKDGTANVIANYRDPRIKVISQLNCGESVARNTALKVVKGEYLAFLDADDVFLPDHLELAMGYLLNHPETDAVYTDGHYCDGDGKLIQTLSSLRRGPFEGRIFEELVRASDVFGPPTCVVLRHSIVSQHDLKFDPAIIIGPDWDFLPQYAEHASFGYIDQPTCLYRVHQTNVTVRTKVEKRALSLVRCREKAIKLPGFRSCTVEIRVHVFYDLLINLLDNYPDHQMDVVQQDEFLELPSKEQSRLLRLMASKAILKGWDAKYIDDWLARSKRLNPKDQKGALINVFYDFSPSLCISLLRLKDMSKRKSAKTTIFGDLRY
jgi:glycosyltransferase involved in cell wall biosynthesis